jgi:glutamate--cysteine ligase
MGADGITMMCNTAGLQFCVDAGERNSLAKRWAALHALGPSLVALFANSPDPAGGPTGWVSSRMRTVMRTDPVRTRPAEITDDPAGSWARRVLDTPLLCLRRKGGSWDAPHGVTFSDWIAGAINPPPSTDDLDYHLSTMFTPVRPQGYFEVRYLDAQPGQDWLTPVGLLTALTSTERTIDAVVEACAAAADRWLPAARDGLADPVIAKTARAVLEIGTAALSDIGLTREMTASVTNDLDHLLHGARGVHQP